VAEHRPTFSVRRMCQCLNIHPSGFYAWFKNPLSQRAREDAHQTKLLIDAWKDSGKVYGYRKCRMAGGLQLAQTTLSFGEPDP
jgi:putative transposase